MTQHLIRSKIPHQILTDTFELHCSLGFSLQLVTDNMTEQQHIEYLRQALSEAIKSPPKPTNFRVGCVIVSYKNQDSPEVLSTGYTLELPGNTHAEQSALLKLAATNSSDEAGLPNILRPELNVTLYTTLEPCGKRLSGNLPCVQRIIATRKGSVQAGVRKVIFGAKEPGTFVTDSQSCQLLTEAGIEWEYIPALEEEILQVAMEGHDKKPEVATKDAQPLAKPAQDRSSKGTNVDDISPEERRRQEEQPRNPKKRMMEI
jgi:pyrimidine deaminase RibD-like protein